MALSKDLLIKQRSVMDFLAAEGCAQMVRIFKGEVPKETTVRDRKRSDSDVVRRDKDSILQHDNARPHTSRQTQDALRQLELATLPQPAYSPALAPLTIIFVSPTQEVPEGPSL
ncbi:histone-lysine N-methyltransferase SETMAR [Plakobranchus ocellatus]|uniref:Histone-lysine N-methyltransferase SETMAR n=1 Tax=Plakobranchus ocellatus TaxID=259542 RepID=A0AAV4ALT5_9GAST|nr:histone-lysine N-methyltransferase SETMAR [Plakobranchus ocellatus]